MKKMMFNDRYGLTKAVLEKRKTVTRRLLKQTKLRSLANCLQGIKYECMVDENGNNYEAPYYVGEIVAVAQCYGSLVIYNPDRCYPELTKKINKAHNICCEHIGHLEEVAGWTNKMFVKADLMPHQIRIIDVRAERLQDITEEDCLREGIVYHTKINWSKPTEPFRCGKIKETTARKAFADLIDKISGKGTWNSNPFVWRIEFELVTEKQ